MRSPRASTATPRCASADAADLDPLVLQGARVLEQAEGGRCPILLQEPANLCHRIQDPGSLGADQIAVLLAGLNSPGRTVVIEARPRATTPRNAAAFRRQRRERALRRNGRRITLEGRRNCMRAKLRACGPSSPPFLSPRLVVEGSEIIVEGVMTNPLRTGLLTTLLEMGADISFENRRIEGGEEVADVRARYSPDLRGVDVPAARAPSMIDDIRSWAWSRPSPPAKRECAVFPSCGSRNLTGLPQSPLA